MATAQKKTTGARPATLDHLKKKKRSETTFSIFLNEDGESVELTLRYRALGAREYDKLVAKFPPTAEQRLEGASFNLETFAPALIAASAIEPEMSHADAKEIWESEDWSRGDLMVLFRNAVELNNRGIDIPFSASV